MSSLKLTFIFLFFSNIRKDEETHVYRTVTKKIYILERKEEGDRKKEKTYTSTTKADLVDNMIRILVFSQSLLFFIKFPTV
jgi:hypothetical protein